MLSRWVSTIMTTTCNTHLTPSLTCNVVQVCLHMTTTYNTHLMRCCPGQSPHRCYINMTHLTPSLTCDVVQVGLHTSATYNTHTWPLALPVTLSRSVSTLLLHTTHTPDPQPHLWCCPGGSPHFCYIQHTHLTPSLTCDIVQVGLHTSATYNTHTWPLALPVTLSRSVSTVLLHTTHTPDP